MLFASTDLQSLFNNNYGPLGFYTKMLYILAESYTLTHNNTDSQMV
jgi:hypothetical protein